MEAIRNLKNILFLLIILISPSVFAQIDDQKKDPFIGVWEYRNDNRIFRLIIWEERTLDPNKNSYYLDGYYEMAEINGLVETVLYTSKPENMLYKNTQAAFKGIVENGVYSGKIMDLKENRSGLTGDFKIVMLPYCSDCQPKIRWEVSNLSRIYTEGGTLVTVPASDLILINGVVLLKIK